MVGKARQRCDQHDHEARGGRGVRGHAEQEHQHRDREDPAARAERPDHDPDPDTDGDREQDELHQADSFGVGGSWSIVSAASSRQEPHRGAPIGSRDRPRGGTMSQDPRAGAPARPDPAAPALLDPASPAMGARIAEAWRLGGPVAAAGVGERFAAWRVTPQGRAAVIVRVAHVAPEERHQDLAHELAALTLIPPEVGPAPIAVHDEASTSPLGHPCVVTTDVPGVAAAPGAWTGAHLRSHARLLARLHSVPAPGRGPVSSGPEPWAAVPVGTPQLLAEVEAEVGVWRERHGALLAEHGLEPFLEAALTGVAGIEDQIASLEGFSLCHGDLCATNILWAGTDAASSDPRVQYIDFEWAQGDDPARDLAIIGGRVHGGPWYVPLAEEQV